MPLSFSDSPNPLSSGLPEWYLKSRKSAWDNFLDTPFPQRKDENWRFANLKKISYENITDAEKNDEFDYEQHISHSVSLNGDSDKIIFNNDSLSFQSPIDNDLLAKGFIFKPLSQALIEHGDLIQSYFMKEEPKLGSD